MRDDLMEIRIHGRGGQGNVVAAYLLAEAAIAAQFFAQVLSHSWCRKARRACDRFCTLFQIPF